MKLSICMMVKNEESNLERCLISLERLRKEVTSELIVVDTGSNDRTIDIAKKFTDKVYFHQWNNNFSEMRNITIKYAKGSWILIIDADEEVRENEDDLIKFLNSNIEKEYGVAALSVKNITEIVNDKEKFSVISSARLFRNDGYFRYKGSVHNMPVFRGKGIHINTEIRHYGYLSNDLELMEKKFKRTSTLLIKELEKNPDNIYYRFQLSNSYAMHGDNKKALDEILLAYNNMKKSNVNVEGYIYIYSSMAIRLFEDERYEEAINICKEGLEVEKNYIDLYFIMGKALGRKKIYDQAIEYFEKYLEIANNYENLEVNKNNLIEVYSLAFKESVYYDLAALYYEIDEYSLSFKYIKICTTKKIELDKIDLSVFLIYKLEEYDELRELYKQILSLDDNQLESQLIICIEKNKEKLDNDKKIEIAKLFVDFNTCYSEYNGLRVDFYNKNENLNDKIIRFANKYDINQMLSVYGDLFYFIIDRGYDFDFLVNDLTETKLDEYFEYLNINYSDLSYKIMNYISNLQNNEKYSTIKIMKIMEKYVILMNKISGEGYLTLFKDYVSNGIRYMKLVYNEYIFKNELIYNFHNDEEVFLYYMLKAKEYYESENKKYIEYLKKALEKAPQMKKGISLLLSEFEKIQYEKEQQFNRYKEQIINRINYLVNNQIIDEAKGLINKFENIIKNDVDIYSAKAAILIGENNLGEAEIILKEGLRIYNDNFDLFYNLGYLYSIQDRKIEALSAYTIAKILCKDNYYKNLVEENILKLNDIRINSYNVILCGSYEQCENFEEIFSEWNVVGYILCENDNRVDENVLSIDKIHDYKYDFIMIVDENNEKNFLEELIEYNVENNIYFSSSFKTSVIEGIDYRIRELLYKNNVEMIITGSSYAEVGIKVENLNKNAINFAFSSQDLFYDYQIFNYLLNYRAVKRNVKYAILGLSYYCFDYDISKSIAKYRIHRYSDYIRNFHNNNDEIGIDITKAFYEKRIEMKAYYEMSKWKEATIMKCEDKEQEFVARKNSTMNYDLTRKENVDIFHNYLSLLKANNIKPIIVICPTSKYYYKYFSDCYQKNKFYKILDSFKEKFDFQVIDYFDSNLFEEEEFWDYGHLNGKGASKFTQILNKEIIWKK